MVSVRPSRPNEWRQRPYTEVLFTVLFYLQQNIDTHTADTFTAVQTRSSSSATLQQITSSPSPTCVLFFYSPPLGRDLWTRVRCPTGPACRHRRKGRDFWTTVRHECCQSSRMQDWWTAWTLSSHKERSRRHVCRCTAWPPVELSKVDRVTCHWPW